MGELSAKASVKVLMGSFHRFAQAGTPQGAQVGQRLIERGRPQQYGSWGVLKIVLTLVACSLITQAAAAPPKAVRRVLIINAFSSYAPATVMVNESIRRILEKSPYQIELYQEYLETTAFPDPSTRESIRESYLEKYRTRKPDVLLTVGLSAIQFVSEAHERFFPETPVVFCCGAEQLAGNLKLDSQFTGIWMAPQIEPTLDAALALQPDTKHVVVVGGTGRMDRLGEAFVRERWRSFESRLEFTYLTDLTMPILLERLSRLPSNTIIFYTSFSQDAAGTYFIDASQSIPMIIAAANAPVFVTADALVGKGTVGGYVTSYATQGEAAATIAVRILNGERPQDIPIVRSANLYLFDSRALHRWGFEEKNLPANSTVLYRAPTPWELYKWQIVGALLFLIGLTFLSGYLLFERTRRKRAEKSLVRQLRFETLISEISSEFMNLPSARVESGIRNNLIRLREFLGIDRVSIYEFVDNETNLCLRHSAQGEGTAGAPEILSKQKFPWLFAQLVGEEPVVISQLDLPNYANGERELFQEMNARAIVIFPLAIETSLVGILSFVVLQERSCWPEDLLPQLKAVSQLSTNAFARELAQRALFESEARFRVMGDAAPSFIWMSDQQGNFTYLNKKTLDFTGAKVQDMNGDGWSSYIHPNDLRAALDANTQGLQQRERFQREYRVRRSDGIYRWMFDIANPRFDTEGKFVGFIGSAVDVTDQKMAREALEKLSGQLIAAQERERSHIARELHDDICQRLAMLSLKIEKVNKGWGSGKMSESDQLEQIWQQCSDLTGDVQALSHELHPSLLDNLGLVTAVKSFCREFSLQNGAVIEFADRDIPSSLPREVALSLFRVVQESLHNASKYSGVKQFVVSLRGNSESLELEISDQGVGFDVASVKNLEGLGLVSMRERIHLLNGTISIESKPNAGTRIRARVPLAMQSGVLDAHADHIVN